MPLVAKYDIQYSLFLHQFNHIPYHRRKEMNLLSHFRTLEVSRLQCSFTLCYSMGLVSRASSSWEAWSQSTAASWHGIDKARQSHGGLRLSEDICRIWQRLHKQYQRIQEYSTIFQNIPECFRMFQNVSECFRPSHQPCLRCHGLPVFEFRFVKPLLFPGKQRNGQAIGPQRK